MHDLSIFIDESGDFGAYEHHAPFYLIALLLHEQDKDINNAIQHLDQHIREAGSEGTQTVHSAPLIRREGKYEHLDMGKRKKLFSALFNFLRFSPVTYRVFVFHKKEFGANRNKLVEQMTRDIEEFIRDHLTYFQGYERIIVYYDNGQRELSRVIKSTVVELLN